MTQYSFRRFRRREPTDNLGELDQSVRLKAQGPREAELEAQRHLGEINWHSQFAAIFDEQNSQYIKFWLDTDK